MIAEAVGLAGTGIASEATDASHRRYNQGAYEGIYQQLTQRSQETHSRLTFLSVMGAMRSRPGEHVGAKVSHILVMTGNHGAFTVLTLRSVFARGEATEHFSWRVARGPACSRSSQCSISS